MIQIVSAASETTQMHMHFGRHQDISRCDKCSAALLITSRGSLGCPHCEDDTQLLVGSTLAGALRKC